MTEQGDERASGRRSRRGRPDDLSDAMNRVEDSIERLLHAVREEVRDGFSGETARAFRATADGIDRTARAFERKTGRRRRKRESDEPDRQDSGWESFERPRLARSPDRKIIAGVCGGLADYWGTEPWVVRVFCIIGALFFPHLLIGAYIVAWIFLPRSDRDRSRRRSRRRPRRPDISSHDPIAPEFGGRYAFKKSLRTLREAFREIDRRIRNLEEVVTDPSFAVRREFGKMVD